jgi:hypothetical protein
MLAVTFESDIGPEEPTNAFQAVGLDTEHAVQIGNSLTWVVPVPTISYTFVVRTLQARSEVRHAQPY